MVQASCITIETSDNNLSTQGKSFNSNKTLEFVDETVCFNEQAPPSEEQLKLIGGRCDWSAEDLLSSPFWGLELTPTDLQELEAALRHCKAHGLELQDGWQPLNVSQTIFPLPTLGEKLKLLATELEEGRGACMIRNMPVNDYSLEDLGVIYAGINSYIGQWVPQSSAGLRSASRGYGLPLGKVQAEMKGNTPMGGKQANNYFRLHTDRCDVITLMCVRKASHGGASRVCSAARIHNIMAQEHPWECARLYRPYPRIWEGKDGFFSMPIWAVHKGRMTTQVSPSYIENAQVMEKVPKLSEADIEAIDLIEETGLKESVEFVMEPGMVYWLNNHMVYHGRDAWSYSEAMAADATKVNNNRLMLRMWLSPYNSREIPSTEAYKLVWGSTAAGTPRGGLEPAAKSGLTPKAPELVKAIEAGTYTYYGLYKRKFGVDANTL